MASGFNGGKIRRLKEGGCVFLKGVKITQALGWEERERMKGVYWTGVCLNLLRRTV